MKLLIITPTYEEYQTTVQNWKHNKVVIILGLNNLILHSIWTQLLSNQGVIETCLTIIRVWKIFFFYIIELSFMFNFSKMFLFLIAFSKYCVEFDVILGSTVQDFTLDILTFKLAIQAIPLFLLKAKISILFPRPKSLYYSLFSLYWQHNSLKFWVFTKFVFLQKLEKLFKHWRFFLSY